MNLSCHCFSLQGISVIFNVALGLLKVSIQRYIVFSAQYKKLRCPSQKYCAVFRSASRLCVARAGACAACAAWASAAGKWEAAEITTVCRRLKSSCVLGALQTSRGFIVPGNSVTVQNLLCSYWFSFLSPDHQG